MKRPKNRLQRVIVIGATPAGVAATNKLGELGIAVTLVDSEPDLNKKLSREEWRLDTGNLFNLAYRPGLLRALRNPLIRFVLPAKVTSIKHTPQGFSARIEELQAFVDPNRCTLCGRCAEICPVTTVDGSKPIQISGRGSLPGRPFINKGRQPLCQSHCPLGVNAQGYIALAGAGRFQEALDLVRKENVLPGICGRICTHPCEDECRRSELDAPISIRNIKRFLADYELSENHTPQLPDVLQRTEKIAVIGSGPAGLSAAADLARLGYPVTVFEKEAMPGGLLRYGIGRHRLPREILDNDLKYIQNLGVQFKTSHPIEFPEGVEGLQNDFSAFIVTTGAWVDRKLGAPGEDLHGVEGCLQFLTRFHQGKVKKIDGKVAVIGDGNAAFDLARTLKRLGAEVTILSWFPEDMIPADPEEIKGAKEEGIFLRDKLQVVSFLGKDGTFKSLTCKPTKPGPSDPKGICWPIMIPGSESFELEFDQVLVAIGQTGPFQEASKSLGLNLTPDGFIEVDEVMSTGRPKIFAAGDAVAGPTSVVAAMASGRNAARSVHQVLSGEEIFTKKISRPEDKDFPEIPQDIPSVARSKMSEKQSSARSDNFSEVSLGLNETQVLFDAERCLQCGICSECLLCTDACKALGAVNHNQTYSQELMENAGAVIIADPAVAPAVKGEDVIRAYGPKVAKTDVYAMITRGFAAAANAMLLLGGASQRPKGRGVSFPQPDPELAPDVRVGVFVCRCNDTFGWHEGMAAYVSQLTNQKDIIHAEVVNSACVQEQTSAILRTVREKNITRVLLASCVCCPLDFVCSACTDQRSRLKDTLFKGSGISRSMVEACDLRGEVLRVLKDDPLKALSSFSGFMKRSLDRARRLKPLPTPARTYNFATAVIGESEAAINSALTLASAGFEVLMFGPSEKPLSKKINHANIHWFEGSSVKGISGTLGNFHVFVESANFPKVLQVGAVIIGDKYDRKIPYSPQEGMQGREAAIVMQKRGTTGIPFLYPGKTSIAGLFLASPPGIHVSERKKGAAAAVLASAIMPQGPRPSKGHTVVVDKEGCRGCGRCIRVCPYQAITFKRNEIGGWVTEVDEALCKGCGNCISVCPTNAADSPYRDQTSLEQMLEEVLA